MDIPDLRCACVYPSTRVMGVYVACKTHISARLCFCAVEFGYFQTTDAADQPFGHDISLQLFTNMCRDIYGINITEATIDWTNDYYGQGEHGDSKKCCTSRSYRPAQHPSPSPHLPGGLAVRGTRIIYPNGSIDPWHALSLTMSTNVEHVVVIYIDGTAHCAPMYPASSSDLKALTQCRDDIRSALAKWLSEW